VIHKNALLARKLKTTRERTPIARMVDHLGGELVANRSVLQEGEAVGGWWTWEVSFGFLPFGGAHTKLGGEGVSYSKEGT